MTLRLMAPAQSELDEAISCLQSEYDIRMVTRELQSTIEPRIRVFRSV